mmetsp:Transcript_10656/g.32624  ORF Transcript_10656/g.32624 Transcript_10656/m.32624 type:complete len:202 (-) Transcript_10656:288-893(-)
MSAEFDEQFKILLVGESAVGKSSILLRYTEDMFEDLPQTIGVDFKTQKMDVKGKRVKLTLWDTAGQERFRTLTSAYYRGAHGVIFVYDVTRRETFTSLQEDWLTELENYSTNADLVKMVVGNKIDLEPREVSSEEGAAFAEKANAIYVEASAKTCDGVSKTFGQLVEKILDTPSLCTNTGASGQINVTRPSQDDAASYCSC